MTNRSCHHRKIQTTNHSIPYNKVTCASWEVKVSIDIFGDKMSRSSVMFINCNHCCLLRVMWWIIFSCARFWQKKCCCYCLCIHPWSLISYSYTSRSNINNDFFFFIFFIYMLGTFLSYYWFFSSLPYEDRYFAIFIFFFKISNKCWLLFLSERMLFWYIYLTCCSDSFLEISSIFIFWIISFFSTCSWWNQFLTVFCFHFDSHWFLSFIFASIDDSCSWFLIHKSPNLHSSLPKSSYTIARISTSINSVWYKFW